MYLSVNYLCRDIVLYNVFYYHMLSKWSEDFWKSRKITWNKHQNINTPINTTFAIKRALEQPGVQKYCMNRYWVFSVSIVFHVGKCKTMLHQGHMTVFISGGGGGWSSQCIEAYNSIWMSKNTTFSAKKCVWGGGGAITPTPLCFTHLNVVMLVYCIIYDYIHKDRCYVGCKRWALFMANMVCLLYMNI